MGERDCDGSEYCQATQHIEGCYAGGPPPLDEAERKIEDWRDEAEVRADLAAEKADRDRDRLLAEADEGEAGDES